MTSWRPSKTIRVIAIGLAWKEGRLLASEVTSHAGSVIGVRPIGGAIEFGETRERALVREFMEELGAEVTVTGPWHAIENIFDYEGSQGHEIVFAADIAFADTSFYEREDIVYRIENGANIRAVWVDPGELKRRGIALYPTGLARVIGWK
ncbi:NUDIX domain-containing protein [Rhizobium sp. XQZ8]|uniref:NUDIX hydrolase n=1 Tax=Rhizobium populisoli TaxID=2859785 RepID=UPI001CA4F6D8|nr:NUDIX domain-containing protein [Rhizobium populisoli]MBW6420614.1 NUDIX domain-containing protein [Rhizobium populisoli]